MPDKKDGYAGRFSGSLQYKFVLESEDSQHLITETFYFEKAGRLLPDFRTLYISN
jgi:hypothetical protein